MKKQSKNIEYKEIKFEMVKFDQAFLLTMLQRHDWKQFHLETFFFVGISEICMHIAKFIILNQIRFFWAIKAIKLQTIFTQYRPFTIEILGGGSNSHTPYLKQIKAMKVAQLEEGFTNACARFAIKLLHLLLN